MSNTLPITARQILLLDILCKELGRETFETREIIDLSRREAHYLIKDLMYMKTVISQREENNHA